ncbi:MAG: DMT family transporter [Fibrobacterales bacterium]
MRKQTIILHSALILLSVPALFAKGIDMPAGMLIWWRCFIGAIASLLILWRVKKLAIPSGQRKWIVLTGSLMGFHWWTFFASIQFSTVAIGILSLFTYPLITVLLEPFFFKTPLSKRQIIGACGILTGVFFLVPELSLENEITLGVLIGVLSAVFFSLRNMLTKKYLNSTSTITTMGYHIIIASVALTLTLPFNNSPFIIPSFEQLGLLTILATFFTLGSHGLLVYSLKSFTPATISILSSLQVVYGPLLAAFCFSEFPPLYFYYGAVIIVGIALYEITTAHYSK